MAAEGIDFEIDHFLANRFVNHRMGNGCPRSLLFEDYLSLLIELGAFIDVGDDLGLHDQIIEGLVAPIGTVGAADGVTTFDELLRSLPRLQTPRPMPELRRLIGA